LGFEWLMLALTSHNNNNNDPLFVHLILNIIYNNYCTCFKVLIFANYDSYRTPHFSGAWQKINSDSPSTYTEDTL